MDFHYFFSLCMTRPFSVLPESLAPLSKVSKISWYALGRTLKFYIRSLNSLHQRAILHISAQHVYMVLLDHSLINSKLLNLPRYCHLKSCGRHQPSPIFYWFLQHYLYPMKTFFPPRFLTLIHYLIQNWIPVWWITYISSSTIPTQWVAFKSLSIYMHIPYSHPN